MIDETLSLRAMGVLDRINMQSCVNAEKFDIKIIYDAAIISEWSYKKLHGP